MPKEHELKTITITSRPGKEYVEVDTLVSVLNKEALALYQQGRDECAEVVHELAENLLKMKKAPARKQTRIGEFLGAFGLN